ncbi:MAG: fumarylacetoacetate hydrolase family protein [Cellvibrionaceae bacterium]
MASASSTTATTTYLRYEHNNKSSFGILIGDTIEELNGDILENPKPTGKKIKLNDVKILTPIEPSKVIAVGLNYKSHIGDRSPLEYPGLFTKFPTSLIAHEENIIAPKDSTNLHYEGEMVLVIGKKASKVSVEEAKDYVFGISIGNDVSERGWQRSDLQWFRAKGSDTFGPIGPYIVTGLDPDNLLLETRVNGEIRQSSNTDLLIFNVATIVSYISQFVTLLPGDIIYSGTPGTTKAIVPGDIVEISLEGVGVLRNGVVKEK